MKNKISVISVVRNEEQYIEEHFNRLKPFVDDFVVIDEESEDRTVEIAKKFTDKVYIFPKVYYHSTYLAQAALLANHNLVLKGEPDEYWQDGLLQRIPEFCNCIEDIFKFRVLRTYETKENSTRWLSFNPRIYRKDKVIWSDSLDARIINEENLTIKNIEGEEEVTIRNLRSEKDSICRYRVEAAKRLLHRFNGTQLPLYKSMNMYYEEIITKGIY